MVPPLPNPAVTKTAPAPPTPVTQSSSSGTVPGQAIAEATHKRYLEIHQELKRLRTWMNDEAKRNKDLKTAMGDMSREMRKCVGQLYEGKGANNQPVENPDPSPTHELTALSSCQSFSTCSTKQLPSLLSHLCQYLHSWFLHHPTFLTLDLPAQPFSYIS